MSRVKRKTRKKKKPSQINENLLAVGYIFFGIFMTLSVRTESMGIVGQSIKYILLGLFSKLSILIAFVLIFLGVYKLIYPEKIQYQKIPKLLAFILITVVVLVYGLLQRDFLPRTTPLSLENSRLIFSMAQRGEGSGLITSIITYYFHGLLGTAGTSLLCISLILFVLIYYFKIDPAKFFEIFKTGPTYIKEFIINTKAKITDFVLVDSDEDEDKKVVIKSRKKPIQLQVETDDIEIIHETKEKLVKPEMPENELDLEIPAVMKRPRKLSDDSYVFPGLELLNSREKNPKKDSSSKMKNSKTLESTLLNFGVDAKVKSISQGPTITRYELEPRPGTKVSKVTNLTEDLALALAAQTIRIEAPIPGKSLIGIEIPNDTSEVVSFKDIIESKAFNTSNVDIAFGVGMDIGGNVIVADIARMPHMLVAGATGSGKSVCINTLICSILYKYSPKDVKMIMIDPKMVELSVYNDIPHLLIPVVTNMKKAPNALNWAVAEMNRRYKLFAESKVKDINGYNEKFEERLPRIVLIIDELADLMMVSPNEIEDAICRLAQMARACGIHLVIATQRPSVDVITGLIKANIPSRIAFSVSSQTDSRTILDTGGAEKLLGRGDMLYYPMGANKPVRIQGAFISENEVIKITDFIKEKNNVDIDNTEIIQEIEKIKEQADNPEDELITEILDFIKEKEQASTSLLQRKFRIGYNRASRIIDDLEQKGIVGPSDGVKPRKVYIENIKEK